jgi:hypothetical protein
VFMDRMCNEGNGSRNLVGGQFLALVYSHSRTAYRCQHALRVLVILIWKPNGHHRPDEEHMRKAGAGYDPVSERPEIEKRKV